MSIRDMDRGYRDLLRRIDQKVTISVGVQGSKASAAHEGGEQTVADISSKHEFGIDVPRRSFIRDWFDRNHHNLSDDLERMARAVIEGRGTPEQAAEVFGLIAVAEIQENISDGIAPPNSEATIQQKGSDTPLIDTGQLRSSITHTVEVDGG